MKTELLFNKEEVIQKVRKKQMPIRGVIILEALMLPSLLVLVLIK